MQYKIIVDKQPSSNPSSEKKEYIIDIEELRVKGNVYDSLVITKDEDYVMRRLSLSEYGVLSVLEQEVKEPLENVNIELFEGDNYIYLVDMTGNKFYAEYIVKNDFTDLYVTTNQMNSAITQSADKIELSVNQKLTSYATTDDLEEQVTELNSTISQTASEINAEVEKKVDEETITGAYLILKINGDTSEAKLNADKIELSANDILNLLAGNTINLTSKNIVISSTNFNVDSNGNVVLKDDSTSSTYTSFKIINTNGDRYVILKPFLLDFNNDTNGNYIQNRVTDGSSYIYMGYETKKVEIQTTKDSASIWLTNGNENTTITQSGVTTPKVTQTSLESIKKNITKFTKNATNIINNSDIYEYNLKSDKDEDKKLIGFVIGDNYKTPDEVISKEGQAVELYSAIGILWKGFQERQSKIDKIDKLEERILQLEKEVQHE